MQQELLRADVQQFIHDHEQDDEKQIILKHKNILGIPTAFIADQISGRRKAKVKLPIYYTTQNILYPPGLNLEQSSSQQTAQFKTHILETLSFKKDTCADLTGGFGIDTFFFSKLFAQVDYIEPDKALLAIAQHNHKTFGAGNIRYHVSDAESFINHTTDQYDLVFIDPSRRTKNTKVFRLAECVPDITSLITSVLEKAALLLIKASPLLDITQGLKELIHVCRVYIVSVGNECKEVLFLCDRSFDGEPVIETVNLVKDTAEEFSFLFSEEKEAEVQFSDPRRFLFEPNASILKAGAFKSISKEFNLHKLSINTHLYTGDHAIDNFPGRVFKIEATVRPDAKVLAKFFPEKKANVTTRNYPLSVEELRKKTNLKDGGDKYLIGFSGVSKKWLVVVERVR